VSGDSPQNDGRLRFSKQNVVYKSSKTGKVDNIPAAELSQATWRRVCLGHGIKLAASSGHVYKYDGFRDTVRRRWCVVCEND
jgi:structure-specific recognition protein 1